MIQFPHFEIRWFGSTDGAEHYLNEVAKNSPEVKLLQFDEVNTGFRTVIVREKRVGEE